MMSSQVQLAEVFPPGEMLQEKLDELGMPIKEFALRCCKPEPTIHDVLKGRSAITPDMAVLFEAVLDIPARLWMNLQCQYDEYKARRLYGQELDKEVVWGKLFPFSEMIDKGYIQADKQCSPKDKVCCLLRFFGFAKSGAWQKYYQSRILKAELGLSLIGMQEAYAVSAWLRQGERKLGEFQPMPEYSEERLRAVIPSIQTLANGGDNHFLPQLTELCQQAGVFFVCISPLCTSPVRGVTRWLKNTPLVQVADSIKHYDTFWFSFFHAIGHILLHGKREIFFEGVDYEQKQSQKDKEADEYASNCLVPKKTAVQLTDFVYSDGALKEFCAREHLHIAFVAERLHQLKKIQYVVYTKYRLPVAFATK